MSRFAARVLLMFVAILPSAEMRESAASEQAVEAGRRALRKQDDLPWYDAARDGIKRIDVYPPKDLEARKSKWELPKTTWPDWLRSVLEIIGWTLLGLVLGVVLYVLARMLLSITGDWRAGTGIPSDSESMHGDIDRIESLPFQLRTSQTDLLAEARRHYEAGEFSQAIIYFYSYQLVQLDRHRLIRLAKGKTNRQYLREVRPRRELWDLLSHSTVAFEDVFFGRHTLNRERFESCWRRLNDFHQDLARVVE